jgi:23S rRNA (uracil1939-C5)-methyltransferase
MSTPAAPARPSRGDELDLHIDSLAYGGAGVARLDGYVVFVRDTVPGDRVRALVTKRKRAYAEARPVEVIEPSAERIAPVADHPGAPWQVLPYERQLEIKAQQVADALKRIGHLEGFELEPIVPAVEQWRYRNKLEYSFGTGDDGTLVCGFHAPGSWERIVHVEDCLLASERGNAARGAALQWCRDRGLAAYDRRAQEGLLRNLVVREGRRTGELQVRLVTSDAAVDLDGFAEAVGADSVMWTRAADVGETTAGGESEVLHGTEAIEEELTVAGNDLRVRIDAEAFFQTNTEMAERLYGTAVEFAALKGWERVYDLFCGIGTIGLALAPRERRAVGARDRRGGDRRRDRQRAAQRDRQRAVLRGRRARRPARPRRGGGPPGCPRGRPAARGPVGEDRAPDHRDGAEADRLRLVQPDDARAERRPARRGGLAAQARAPGRHVPADAAHRVRGAARARLSRALSRCRRRPA